jgi:hypothetical protein
LQLEASHTSWPRRLGALCAAALVLAALSLSAAPVWFGLAALVVLGLLWRPSGTERYDRLSFSGRRFEPVGPVPAGDLRDHARLGPLISLHLLLDDGRRLRLPHQPRSSIHREIRGGPLRD